MKRLVLFLAIVSAASSASAQHWTKIQLPSTLIQPPYNYPWQKIEPYFINPNYGFIFSYPFVGLQMNGAPAHLHRTIDGGKTWTYLVFFDTSELALSQMSFISPAHGYASTCGFNSRGGIYETRDSGNSWRRISPNREMFATAVYAVDSLIVATEYTKTASTWYPIPMICTRNNGVTWDSIKTVTGLSIDNTQHFVWLYGNKEGLIASVWHLIDTSVNGDPINHHLALAYTSDQGANWQSVAVEPGQLGSFQIPAHQCKIFGFIDRISDDKYTMVESEPDYQFWKKGLTAETGGWISGNSCALYLSNASNASFDFYRSTDVGSVWKPITINDSPYNFLTEIDDEDWPNISVVGYGAVVYATTAPGLVTLWKTTDGGDGSLSTLALAPRMALGHELFPSGNDTLTITQCTSKVTEVYTQNIACSYAKLDSVVLEGLDPFEFSVTSTHHNGCARAGDISSIKLTPQKPGVRNVNIHFHYTDDEFNQIGTAMRIVLDVKAGGVSIPISASIKPTNIRTYGGDTVLIPIYLSGNVTLTGATRISLPLSIDTNMLKVLSFDSRVSGLTVGALAYSNGIETVPLEVQDLTITGETLIGWLRCVAFVSDTLQTTVALVSPTIASESVNCITLTTDSKAAQITLAGCGDSMLLWFMRTGSLVRIDRIVPNPAQSVVKVEGIGLRVEGLEVYDVMGRKLEVTKTSSTAGVDLDVRDLTEGMYYLRAGQSVERFVIRR
jgi:hypothetical protein